MRICSKCGKKIRRWSEPYVMVRNFDLRSWKERIRYFFGPPVESDRTRYHVVCPT